MLKCSRQYAVCSICENKGLPSGFHSVSKDSEFIYVECSTCGDLVLKLKIGEDCKEESYEDKNRACQA